MRNKKWLNRFNLLYETFQISNKNKQICDINISEIEDLLYTLNKAHEEINQTREI